MAQAAEQTDQILPSKQIALRVGRMFAPYKTKVILTLIAVLIGTVVGMAPALFLKVIVDDGFVGGSYATIAQYSIATALVVIVAAGFTLLYGYGAVVVGQAIVCDLRQKLFSHLQSMSLKFFTSSRTGEIQTRLISDIQGIQAVLSSVLVDALSNVSIVVSSLAMMVFIDWRLTLASVIMIPFFAVIGQRVGNFARKVTKGQQEQTAELNSLMQETLSISGILLTKTAGRLDVLTEKFGRENHALAKWQIKVQLLQYLFFGMIRLITTLAPVVIYWLAAWLMFKNGDTSLTLGKIFAFSFLQTRMLFPLTGLMGLQVEIMKSFALFDRLFEYLDLPLDVEESPGATALDTASMHGKVEFRDVQFKYEDAAADWTLDGITFTAEAGQLVALVGPSGAGKTTLTYLIPRLYDSNNGQILIDGQDVKSLKLDSLATTVGAVTQETYLLHATIKDNLLLADPDASQDDLEAACKMAAIHDHIAGLDEGYETVVGERGYKLSGGEKQRLAIARAILKNPRILILDEATSALDTRSERLIQESLTQLMKGRTTFAIAHRLSTILEADKILVIKDGRLVEQGVHDELLNLDGLYAQLYNEQFRSETEEPVS
jgi:ATP-binding cassette subfamily B protein